MHGPSLGIDQRPSMKKDGDIHSIPCKLNFDGPAPVSRYFIQRIDEDSRRHAAFRGHGLEGITLDLPSGYKLYVLKKRGKTVFFSVDDMYDIESQRDSFALWEWDREAGERSVMARALSQLEIAHKLADD
ncbi:unnamed protein product [Angiostrongylus costaricensis]|uniref:GOLD domain-containing protein n=1 Tax=Angiostrongylus costaricensis TaxID=334426 RepID=A0A0R3PUL6_ANGCS|nr:unnamed protein product [Angiostrongylus costaricensis]